MERDVERLTRAAIEGDGAAVEELIEHYLPDLRTFVRLRAGPLIRAKESTSDLVQSVCREVLEHMDRFQYAGDGAFKSWLFTTAMRKILNRRDYYLAEKRDVQRDEVRQSRYDALLLESYRTFSTPSARAGVREELERVEAVFDQLSDEQREVILLAHVVGLSRSEIAERMGKTEGAVRVLLHRSLARVSGLLKA